MTTAIVFPEAITTYKRFRDYDKVVMVMGWGTGDTESLSPTINADKMPYLSSSFSGNLCDPKKTPYNFVYGVDYSTNARGAITYWFEEVWKKDPKWKDLREKGAKPKFACFIDTSSPFATAPAKAIKDQATLLGFEIGPDYNIPLTALDAKSQIHRRQEFRGQSRVAWQYDHVHLDHTQRRLLAGSRCRPHHDPLGLR